MRLPNLLIEEVMVELRAPVIERTLPGYFHMSSVSQNKFFVKTISELGSQGSPNKLLLIF